MAETCAIKFLILVSYSTSTVLGGLRRRLLAVLMWDGVDLEYFRPETAWCSFFSKFDRSWSKNEKSYCSDFRNPRRTADVVFKVNEKLSECWRITPLGGAKHANFLKKLAILSAPP